MHIETLINHIQSYSGIFSSTLYNPLGILEYLEPFCNYILTDIENPVIFTKIYEFGVFGDLSSVKIVKNHNYFSKGPHLSLCTSL